jgi:phosphoribosylanthranilate isomerase
MIVQIYEIQTPQEAERCIELGVDHLGSVLLSEDEWRSPLLREVTSLTRGTGVKNSLIPLFGTLRTLWKTLDYYRPHYIHFCQNLMGSSGNELDLDRIIDLQRELRQRFSGIGIIRSIPIPRGRQGLKKPVLDMACALEPVSDLFVTDTWLGKEPVEGYIGITGETADWDTSRQLVLRSHIPVILAGGLSPQNVYTALEQVRPAGADSCTQTNAVGGDGRPIRFKKDFKRVKAFVREVRRFEKGAQANGKFTGSPRIP